MALYRVSGADRETGQDITRDFTAPDAEAARVAANQAGIVVSSVREIQPASPEQAVLDAIQVLTEEVAAARHAINFASQQIRTDLERSKRVHVTKRSGMTFGEYFSWSFTIASGIILSSVLGFCIVWGIIALGVGGLAGLAAGNQNNQPPPAADWRELLREGAEE